MTDTTTLPDDVGERFVTVLRETLDSAADALGDLDRRAGDGDFGANVRTAMRLFGRNIADGPSSYREWLSAMSLAWLGVGGTSGPLFGMFFRELAKAGPDADGTDQETTPTLAQFADALAAGQAVVQKYGEASVGDKTLIDALAPAVTALQDAVTAGEEPGAALAAAEQAALEGARGTAETVARRGRASYLGETAKGVIDPGAAAVALMLGAARAAATDGSDIDTSWIA